MNRDPHGIIQRRAYDKDGRMFTPGNLGDMRREDGIRNIDAQCHRCGHDAVVNVDRLPDQIFVPDVGLHMRCSVCGAGGEWISTRPDWRGFAAPGRGGYG